MRTGLLVQLGLGTLLTWGAPLDGQLRGAIAAAQSPGTKIPMLRWASARRRRGERRGLQRFRTEQPPYSMLNRGIERDVLPLAQQYGMGTLVWGPLGQGMLTGRVRKGHTMDVRRAGMPKALSDERRLDAFEQLLTLADEVGLSITHLAMGFAIAHPGVSTALLGARTTEQLDDLLAGVDVALSDEVLDRIDEIVPPGTDVGTLDQAYVPPALQDVTQRRRPFWQRSAA
jgi:aryl-alcohol dehydrogenase-like predicted oxidoreductase